MKTNEILTATQTDNLCDAMAAIYTDSELMLWWLARPAALRDKLARAQLALQTARAPRGRFGLDVVPADVLAVIEAFEAACRRDADAIATGLRAARARKSRSARFWQRTRQSRSSEREIDTVDDFPS